MDEIAKPDQLLEKLADDLKQLLVERAIDDNMAAAIIVQSWLNSQQER